MQILIQQVQGRTPLAFLTSGLGKPEPTLRSQGYVIVFTGLSRPPPDGSMSASCGSCCSAAFFLKTQNKIVCVRLWCRNIWPSKWEKTQPSEALSLIHHGEPAAFCSVLVPASLAQHLGLWNLLCLSVSPMCDLEAMVCHLHIPQHQDGALFSVNGGTQYLRNGCSCYLW